MLSIAFFESSSEATRATSSRSKYQRVSEKDVKFDIRDFDKIVCLMPNDGRLMNCADGEKFLRSKILIRKRKILMFLKKLTQTETQYGSASICSVSD